MNAYFLPPRFGSEGIEGAELVVPAAVGLPLLSVFPCIAEGPGGGYLWRGVPSV